MIEKRKLWRRSLSFEKFLFVRKQWRRNDQLSSVFQVLGMSLGAIIMLLIALYEHDMKTLFENHQPHD